MSTVAVGTRVARELIAISGPDHVTEAPRERILGCAPAVAVRPGSAEEIAAVLRFANQTGLVVVPAGGLTQQESGKPPAQIDILLYTTRLTETEHYDPGDLTVGIGAGCRVAQLCSNIAKDGLLFAADPPLWERATVGGLLATGIAGPRRHGYGGLRDYCIGIRFVVGDGRLGKGGGRVVKNVAGYDMMKLLIGSYGTLAVITGASFKLFPRPAQPRTFVSCFASAAEAIDFRNRVLRSPLDPMCLELLSPEAHKLIAPDSPAAVSWSICVRGAGSDQVLARYRAELGSTVAREMEGENEAGFWRKIADFAPLASERAPESLVVSFALPLTEVLPVLNQAAAVAAGNGLQFGAVGRVGVGHLLVSLSATHAPPDFVSVLSALRDGLSPDAGMTVLYSPEASRGSIEPWRTPTHMESMRIIKQTLDPKDILNRGRFPL